MAITRVNQGEIVEVPFELPDGSILPHPALVLSNPVLTGDVAERFIEIAESSRNTATTVIPEGAQDAIRRMMERSKNVKIKLPH